MHVSVGILHYVCTIWLSVQYEINTYIRHQQVYACICRYLYYDCTMCSILHYVLAVCLRKDSGSPSEAHSHRFGFIPIHFSSGKGRVVIGPDHGPHVDVEQGTYTTGSGDGRYMHFVPIWPWQWWAECTSSERTYSWIQPKDTVIANVSVQSITFLHIPTWYIQDTCRYMHIPTFHT